MGASHGESWIAAMSDVTVVVPTAAGNHTSPSVPTPTSNSSKQKKSAKRGRKQDDTLPPSRSRDVQRAFRARKVEHLAMLDNRLARLEEENNQLRARLGETPRIMTPPLHHRDSLDFVDGESDGSVRLGDGADDSLSVESPLIKPTGLWPNEVRSTLPRVGEGSSSYPNSGSVQRSAETQLASTATGQDSTWSPAGIVPQRAVQHPYSHVDGLPQTNSSPQHMSTPFPYPGPTSQQHLSMHHMQQSYHSEQLQHQQHDHQGQHNVQNQSAPSRVHLGPPRSHRHITPHSHSHFASKQGPVSSPSLQLPGGRLSPAVEYNSQYLGQQSPHSPVGVYWSGHPQYARSDRGSDPSVPLQGLERSSMRSPHAAHQSISVHSSDGSHGLPSPRVSSSHLSAQQTVPYQVEVLQGESSQLQPRRSLGADGGGDSNTPAIVSGLAVGPSPSLEQERAFLTACCGIPENEVHIVTPYMAFCRTLMRGLEVTGKGPSQRTSRTKKELKELEKNSSSASPSAVEPDDCCGGIVDCSGPLFEDAPESSSQLPRGFVPSLVAWNVVDYASSAMHHDVTSISTATALAQLVLDYGRDTLTPPSRLPAKGLSQTAPNSSINLLCDKHHGLLISEIALTEVERMVQEIRRHQQGRADGGELMSLSMSHQGVMDGNLARQNNRHDPSGGPGLEPERRQVQLKQEFGEYDPQHSFVSSNGSDQGIGQLMPLSGPRNATESGAGGTRTAEGGDGRWMS